MTFDLALVLACLVAAVIMFVIGRPRMDVVAILMMTLLPLLGLVSVQEAMAGLADPNIVLIAALFVIGEGLVRTGVAQRLGDFLVARSGASETRLIVLLMLLVTALGSVMSSTGVVAIFIPIVLRIARATGTNVSRLMMPLSMAALISGMMTLVATAPNLVIHAELIRQGHSGFGFFDFTPFGLPILGLAILYMLFARRFLGSAEAGAGGKDAPSHADWIDAYGLEGREFRLRITAPSPLIGRSLGDADLRGSAGISIIAIERARHFRPMLAPRFGFDTDLVYDRKIFRPEANSRLENGDVLLIDCLGGDARVEVLCRELGLERLECTSEHLQVIQNEIGMAEVLVNPLSPLVGRTAVEATLRSQTGLTLLGLRRGRAAMEAPVAEIAMRAGDTLLITGDWRAIHRLKQDQDDLVLLTLPLEAGDVAPEARRAPLALLSLAVTIGLMVSGLVPNVIAAFIGCLMMGAFRCIDMEGAYRAINWPSLLLIVGMMPFSAALQATGGVDLAAQGLLAVVGDASPRTTLAVLFAVTAGLGLFISNTATAVLMAPVALAVAAELGASPYPFAMTVALAASAAFMTPVSSPVNTLVVAPGNYGFFDFVRIGVPFTVLTLIVSVILLPILMPL